LLLGGAGFVTMQSLLRLWEVALGAVAIAVPVGDGGGRRMAESRKEGKADQALGKVKQVANKCASEVLTACERERVRFRAVAGLVFAQGRERSWVLWRSSSWSWWCCFCSVASGVAAISGAAAEGKGSLSCRRKTCDRQVACEFWADPAGRGTERAERAGVVGSVCGIPWGWCSPCRAVC
jgi:hypothetical protein